MSRCVPSWDLDETNVNSSRLIPSFHHNGDPNSTHSSASPENAMFDYEVAELTWENGQLAMHGLGPPRPAASAKPHSSTKYPWEKPRACGTLEAIVDQATTTTTCLLPPPKGGGGGELVIPWFNPKAAPPAMDALVPCSNRPISAAARAADPDGGISARVVGSSKRAGSCSGAAEEARRRKRRTRVGNGGEGSGSSRHVAADTYEMDVDEEEETGFTSTSLGSHVHTSVDVMPQSSSRTKPTATTVDDHDSVCHSRTQKEAGSGDEIHEKNGNMGRSSISTKRSRAAAIHNQSERKRRDRINQRMKTLQKLVPNSNKTDKASMLDEVIEYLKQLQAQVQMMSKMGSIGPHMMMPMAMQQIQMSMMAQMGMGMGMGMGVIDMNSINRTGHPAAPVPPMLHPAAFLPLTAAAAWPDGSGDRLQPPPGVVPDPYSTAFLACQTQQPMNLDAYNRMAASYQQLQQSSGLAPPSSKT